MGVFDSEENAFRASFGGVDVFDFRQFCVLLMNLLSEI